MSYDYVSSLPAYKEPKDVSRAAVFSAIRKIQPCTDRQLSEFLNWPINRITPRRGELVTKGLVIQEKKGLDPLTNRTVSFWSANPIQ